MQAAWLARFLAREALNRYRITEMLGDGKAGRKAVADIARQLREDFDDWCATPPPRRWPFPSQHRLHPRDVLTFAAHMHVLAMDKGPLQQAYQAVADAGFERGLTMLDDDAGKRARVRQAAAA